MLLSRNIAPAATWCASLIFSVLLIAAASPARADPPVSGAGGLDADLATQAYVVIENYVSRAAVPDQSLPITASDAAGVSVTLRFAGLTVGHGIAVLDNPLSPLTSSTPTDIMPLARKATQAALDDAQANLVQLSANHPGAMPNDLKTLAPLLQLDLQIARVPQRLMVESLAELPSRVTIDAQGLALHDANNGRWAWQFPGQAVAANLSLQAQLNRLLSGLGMNPSSLPNIAKPDGPALFRFDIVQIVRPRAGRPPLSLYRGQVLMPAAPLDLLAISQYARHWADRLVARQHNDGSFDGTFEPSLSRFDPQRANPADAALACYALASYGKTLGPEAAAPFNDAARKGLVKLMADLGATPAATQATRTVQATTQDTAMTLLALLELPGNARYKQQRDRMATWLATAYTQNKGFRGSPNIQSLIATAPVRAAAALAMVRMYDQTRQPQYLQIARAELESLWADAAQKQNDAIMPWAALAEFQLARMGQPSPGLLMAQKSCDAMWQAQVQPGAQTPPDLVGGFRTAGGLIDEPTWLTAGPLIALADALTVKKFIAPADQPQWMLNVALGLRYCAQLTMTEQSAYYVRDIKRATGALRSSSYDNRQPTAATAYALLAASEFQQALSRMVHQK